MDATLDRRRELSAVSALTFLAACAWLLVRPELRGVAHEAVLLGLGYLAIGSVAALAPVPAAAERTILSLTAVLAFGVGCVLLVAWVVGPPVPVAASSVAPVLNVLAALAEEAVFRRLGFGWLRRYGAVVAVLGTASVFALIHVPAYGFEVLPVDLGAGLLLSWQRAASGTWFVPAATHAVANLLAVIR
jgi:membrane protease YdiL (CAAX protease family)